MTKTKLFKYTAVLSVCCLMVLKLSPVYAAKNIPTGIELPKFKMIVPDLQENRDYLGIQNAKAFTLSDINAKLIIVELFSTFCSVCHTQAPILNNLHKIIEGNPELQNDVKVMGIVIMSKPEALAVYTKKFGVKFPLIADPEGKIMTRLKVTHVPQTLLIDKNGKVLSNHPGVIHNVDDFLREIRKNLK